jgi:hypothetical protein
VLLIPQLEERQILELIRHGATHEFLLYFPHFIPEFQRLQYQHEHLCNISQQFMDAAKHFLSKKDFAIAVNSCALNFILIAAYVQNCFDIWEFLSLQSEKEFGLTMNKVYRTLGIVKKS